jgi:glycosyltransferase involved in cell wall biosynthesis
MLKDQGVESDILSVKGKGKNKQSYEGDVFEFESSFPFKFYKSSAAIEWFKSNMKSYDAVYLHGIWSFIHMEVASLCLKHDIDYIIRPHSNLDPLDLKKKYWLKQLVGHLWLKKILKSAKYLHTTAEVETERIITYGAEVNFYEVGLPIPSKDLHETVSVKKIAKPIQFLFLSRIHPKKGLDFLLEVLSNLDDDAYHLTICGTGEKSYEKYIQSIIGKNKLEHNVTLKGFVSGKEKEEIIKSSDVFVLSSHFENFGNVIFEMLRFNKPVIISKNIFIWKELSKHDVGWFLDLDKKSWKNTLSSILNNPALLNKKTSEYENALNEYSFEEIGPNYVEMLVG